MGLLIFLKDYWDMWWVEWFLGVEWNYVGVLEGSLWGFR